MSRTAVMQTLSRLQTVNMANDKHQIIYYAIKDLYDEFVPIDFISVGDRLRASNQLQQVGGGSYLIEAALARHSEGNLLDKIEAVKQSSVRREMAEIASLIKQRAKKKGKLDDDDINEIKWRTIALSLYEHNDILFDGQPFFTKPTTRPEPLLLTGLRDVDARLGKVSPGELIVVAGESASGKSALALRIATQLGMEETTPVLLFSLE